MLHPGHLDRIVYKAKRKETATIFDSMLCANVTCLKDLPLFV